MTERDRKLQEVCNELVPILKKLDDYKDINSLLVKRVDDYFCWVVGEFASGRKFYAPVHTESISAAFRDIVKRLDSNHSEKPPFPGIENL